MGMSMTLSDLKIRKARQFLIGRLKILGDILYSVPVSYPLEDHPWSAGIRTQSSGFTGGSDTFPHHPKERYVGVEPTKTCLEGRNLNRSACNANCQHYSTPTQLRDGLSPPSLHMAVDAFTRVKGSDVGELTTALFSAIVYCGENRT